MSTPVNVDPVWIEEQYRIWRESPEQLPVEWRAFFAGYELAEARPDRPGPMPGKLSCLDCSLKQSGVQSLIYRYRDIGHLLACTDPLSPCKLSLPLLELATFGLDEGDLDTVFHTRRFLRETATLREIVDILRGTYCHSLGVEFMYLQDPVERQWLIDRMEPVRNRPHLATEVRLRILHSLQEATLFESFLHRRFVGQKRFSLEGGEVLIPLLDEAMRHAGELGVTDLVLGMPHRGRLNVLANLFRKPYANIFAEFEDNLGETIIGDGDVKYHKGHSTDLQLADGRSIHLTLAFNPSHLEAVDPVVEGKSRARQDRFGVDGERRVLPVLVHGDAAFAGQGMVAETLNLSQLEGYRTGGTLHVVLNNQIGFTTLPADARSTRYATDVVKMLQVPIFHLHGEDPEAAAHAVRLALDYRQAFGRDVVIEIICYRRHGHNEGDEPYFTQPLMYRSIRERPPAHEIYAARLLDEGVKEEIIRQFATGIAARLNEAIGQPARPVDDGFKGSWSGVRREWVPLTVDTAVTAEILRELTGKLVQLPPGFTPHPKVMALLEKRQEAVASGKGIDWGNVETLAYASLLEEGISVRLSGQDSRRGTFNHRHAILYDQENGASHVPLASVCAGGAAFRVYDSMLAENAVLGFEYGYSLEAPEVLTIWEAQFGDFANGAQVIIDQFIASGETKWDRSNGLVMLLPHGYEGQGAEHSSARIERFLQLCAGNNLQVVYPSTPAQLFHLLRRQVRQPFRKPLIVFTPKSLLRHPRCVSRLEDLAAGRFREVLPDDGDAAKVRTVLLCTGKIFYELLERRETDGRDDVAIVRIEQLYPLRLDLLREALAGYHNVSGWRWVQEEPRNMGAWSFLQHHLAEVIGRKPEYVGRPEDAAPAVGSHKLHKEQQERIVAQAFDNP